jgi:methionine aminopeptidase
MGAHIDGYAVISAETIVVGATSPITDIRASLLAAAYQAGEVAIRLVKPGVSNWEVTAGIQKVLKEYEAVGVKGVEGILSHQVSTIVEVSRASFHGRRCNLR